MDREQERLLNQLLEGQLTEADSASLEDHLKKDEAFRQEFIQLTTHDRLLRSLFDGKAGNISAHVRNHLRAVNSSEDFVKQVHQRIDRSNSSRRKPQTVVLKKQFAGWKPLSAAAILLLALGLALWLNPSKQIATIIALSGSVSIETQGKPRNAATGNSILSGDILSTQKAAQLKLAYKDGTWIELSAESTATIAQSNEADAKSIELKAGTLVADVQPQNPDRPLSITTPHGRVTVRGTVFKLQVSAQNSRLEVSRGKVELERSSDSSKVLVSENHFAVAAADSKLPLESKTLPKRVVLKPKNGGTEINPDLSLLDIAPGDTLVIPAGRYKTISLVNFVGSAEMPVSVVNEGGVVHCSRIFIERAKFFKLSGSGSTDQYGFSIEDNLNEAGLTVSRNSTDFEIERVEISKCGGGLHSFISPVENDLTTQAGGWSQKNIKIHDCYIHDIHEDGMYIGFLFVDIPQNTKLPPVVLKSVMIFNNRIENIGLNGIITANIQEGAEISANTIKNFGQRGEKFRQTGLILGANCNGRVVDNIIENGPGPGISVFGIGEISVSGNKVVNAGNTNAQDAIFANDIIPGAKDSQKLHLHIFKNELRGFTRSAIRSANANESTVPGVIEENVIYKSPNLPQELLIVSNAKDVIRNNDYKLDQK